MSYPGSTLKRFYRSPLPGKMQVGGTQGDSSAPIAKTAARGPNRTSSDVDLLSTMATRLATVERELLNAKREILEKVPRALNALLYDNLLK